MMHFLSPFEIVYCSAVMVLSYSLRGSTGFGAAAAMPLLALVIPLKVLIPAWTLIGLAAGVTLLGRDRAYIAWDHMARLAPTCLVGIGVGLYVFTALDSNSLARGLGALIVVYGGYSLWLTSRAPLHWQTSARIVAPLAGVFAGAVGTTFGTMASVFFAIYFDVVRMSKEEFRATMSAVLVALGIVRGLGYWAVGEYTRDVLMTVAIALPMMLLGIFIGDRIHSGLSALSFRRLISGALIASGLALMVRSS
jgi:uncharacterized membrane protein YfcA